jgi:hypothetical protein
MKSGQILFCIFISKPYWHILGARYHNNVESVEHKPFRCSKKQDGVCTFLRCCFVIVVVIIIIVVVIIIIIIIISPEIHQRLQGHFS